ncbi:hypothetical protein AB0N87_43365 [Streptomyces sp. NPDC093228]|uniref:hypothetical protein n=1 Tax=Streptomyces sp. NPDC093228 TaxID=3155070 RepID=UPI0034245143
MPNHSEFLVPGRLVADLVAVEARRDKTREGKRPQQAPPVLDEGRDVRQATLIDALSEVWQTPALREFTLDEVRQAFEIQQRIGRSPLVIGRDAQAQALRERHMRHLAEITGAFHDGGEEAAQTMAAALAAPGSGPGLFVSGRDHRRVSEKPGVPVTPVLFKNSRLSVDTAPVAAAVEVRAEGGAGEAEFREAGAGAFGAEDLLDLGVFRERTTDPASAELRSLSHLADLDRLLSVYQGADEQDRAQRATVLDGLARRAREFAAGTKNDVHRHVVEQLIGQAEIRADDYRRLSTDQEMDRAAAQDAPVGPLGWRERVRLAKREWQGPVAEEVARLEQRLLDAGPGARSLVLGAGVGDPLSRFMQRPFFPPISSRDR